MGNFFSPKVVAPPEKKPVTPLPIEDSEAQRRERLKTIARAGRGGRASTMMTAGRMGDASAAETRGGFGSTVLTG